MTIEIEKSVAGDGVEMARLHLESLPSGLSPIAGRHLLETYYSCLAGEEGGIGYVAREDGELFGFVVGVWARRRILVASLRRHPIRVAFWSFMEFGLKRLPETLRQLRKSGSGRASAVKGLLLPSIELRPLVVDQRRRGCGVGAALCRRMTDDARARSFRSVFLGVHKDNVPAIRCYEKQGFQVMDREGVWVRMVFVLGTPVS